MSDPYGGQFATAGNPWVAANGAGYLQSTDPATRAQYASAYGPDDQARVWAEDYNRTLIQSGLAIQTPHGVMSLDNVKFALGKAGYNGPADSGSLAAAYQMLQSPPQPVPVPQQTAAASASLGGLSLSGGIGGIPRPLLYGAVALLAYEMFFSRRRR